MLLMNVKSGINRSLSYPKAKEGAVEAEAENTFDKKIQQGLDVLRKQVSDTQEPIVTLVPSTVLTEAGFSHTDADRVYSALKRLELVTVMKHGRGVKPPTFLIDMHTTVEQRRIEQVVSHQKHRPVVGNQARLAYLDTQIATTRAHLQRLERERAKLQAVIENNPKTLQTT